MATTKNEIMRWLNKGLWEGQKPDNATHMVVVTDTFDYNDYPVFVTADKDVREEVARLEAQNMTKVMEVYSYAKHLGEQVNEHRAWNLD